MPDTLSPGTVLRAAARAIYGDLVTVVVTSLAVTLAALPVVTLGAALLALVDTWTEIVTRRDTGAPPSERDRFRLFLDSVREYLLAGIPYSLVLFAIAGLTGVYYLLARTNSSGVFLLATILGIYAFVVAVVWCLRAASFQVRSDPPIATRTAFERAGLTLLDWPFFGVILSAVVFALLSVSVVLTVLAPIVMPAVLAIVEVVAFEELAGDGARSIRASYARGD